MVDLQTKVRVIHFGTNRFIVYDFLQTDAVNSNFCSRTHRLATIHYRQADRRTQHCSISATVLSTVG